MDFKNCGSKIVKSSQFFLSKYLCNNWHDIFLTEVGIKPPKDINYVSIECSSCLKLPRKMEGCIIVVYVQEHHSESEKS